MPADIPPRPRRIDRVAAAAVGGALIGLGFAVLFRPLHPALVVTSDAAAAVWLVAGVEATVTSLSGRAIVAINVAALALTYAAALGPLTAASLLLATVLLVASVSPYARR